MIVTAARREGGREGERTEEGGERERGTKQMDDRCSLALPSVHRGCESFCRANERTQRKEGGDTRRGKQDESWRRDGKES